MQTIKTIIREAEPTDIFDLTELMTELGYATSIDEMKTRFENIKNHKDHQTFVATDGKEILGMVGLSKNFSYEQKWNLC